MRHLVPVALFTALVTGACQPAAPELADAERDAIATEIVEVIGGLFEAMNTHDAERILDHYLDSEKFMYVGGTDSHVTRGWLERVVRSWYPRHEDVTFTHQVLHVQVLSQTVAVALTRGGSSETPTLVWTHVLVRGDDGRWVIAHEHEVASDEAPPAEHPT
jgi:ketosteroid isomerase-like protein